MLESLCRFAKGVEEGEVDLKDIRQTLLEQKSTSCRSLVKAVINLIM
jgi:hypothetical protein